MNYIKNVLKLKDKFRLFAIIGLAVAVILLTFIEPHNHESNYKSEHGTSHQR